MIFGPSEPSQSLFYVYQPEVCVRELRSLIGCFKRRGSSRDGRGWGPNPPILSRLRQCLFFALSSPDCESFGAERGTKLKQADVEFQGGFFEHKNSKSCMECEK